MSSFIISFINATRIQAEEADILIAAKIGA
jgi:hypothetical protein